jgi:hypothetical protein
MARKRLTCLLMWHRGPVQIVDHPFPQFIGQDWSDIILGDGCSVVTP